MPKDINQPVDKPQNPGELNKSKPEPEKRQENVDAKFFSYSEREHKNRTESEKMVLKKLMQEVKLMESDEASRNEATQKANKILSMHEDGKLKELLSIAQQKGVVVAIQVAQKTNDPFLLDLLHDILAKEGYYKEFIK